MTRITLSIFLVIFSFQGISQIHDAELWTAASVKSKLIKKLSADFMIQSRFYQNVSTFKTGFVQLSADYDLRSGLAVGFNYRLANKNRISHYEMVNRLCLNLFYQYKIKDLGLRFKVRGRYQREFDRIQAVNDYILPDFESVFRLKLRIDYKNKNFKDLRPFINTEIFSDISELDFTDVTAYRLSAGLNYAISKRHGIKARYIYESNFTDIPRINHIYSISYQYSLKGKLFN